MSQSILTQKFISLKNELTKIQNVVGTDGDGTSLNDRLDAGLVDLQKNIDDLRDEVLALVSESNQKVQGSGAKAVFVTKTLPATELENPVDTSLEVGSINSEFGANKFTLVDGSLVVPQTGTYEVNSTYNVKQSAIVSDADLDFVFSATVQKVNDPDAVVALHTERKYVVSVEDSVSYKTTSLLTLQQGDKLKPGFVSSVSKRDLELGGDFSVVQVFVDPVLDSSSD